MLENDEKEIKEMMNTFYENFHKNHFVDRDFEESLKDIAGDWHSDFCALFVILVFTVHSLKTIINNDKLPNSTREKTENYRTIFQKLIADCSRITKSVDSLFVKFL